MNKLPFTCFLIVSFFSLQTFGQGLAFDWGYTIGGIEEDRGFSIKRDGSGNIYVAGSFRRTADFDPGPDTLNLSTLNNGSATDIFIQKIDPSGNLIWVYSFGGQSSQFDEAYDLALDAQGNIFITGYCSGTVDFDPGPGVANQTANGKDIFILKLDPNGNYLWAKVYDGGFENRGKGVETDQSGNVYLTGRFFNSIDFDPNSAGGMVTANGGAIYVLKLDAGGNYQWVNVYTNNLIGGEEGFDLTVDNNDDVYLCGYFTETVDFDPGANTLMATAEGEEDLFVQKLDPQGNMIWTKTMGGTGRDFYEDIVVDDANQVYLCGYSNGAFDADPGQDTLWLEISGGYDFFVQKLDANGNLRWAHNFQGGIFGYEYARGLALDASANLYITGRFADEVDFDPGPGKREIEALGGEDVFVQKLDSAGNFIYAKAIESTGSSDIGEGLVVDALENVYLTGGFQGMIDLNPGPDSFWVDTRGQMDIFVLKLTPCNHSTITLTESACDSYTAPDGQIFTETGVYTSLISNAVGCDSIITIDLTVNDIDPTIQVNDSTLTAQATGLSYQWMDCDNNYAVIPGATSQSFTPSQAGNYAVELSNNGCVDTSLCEFTNGTMTSIARWEEAKIQIFPNPNNGIFTIDLGKIYPHIQVKVTNILGQVVQEGERTNIKSFEWELPNEKGIYWISFFNQHGMQKSLMIVKQSF